MLAAENILGAKHDLWEVNEEEEYLEEDKRARDEQAVLERVLARSFARMDKLGFATAIGSVSGLFFFIATIYLLIRGDSVLNPYFKLFSEYFIGYTLSVKGSFIAFGYSFVWGFLFGWLFAYLRNLFLAL